MWPRETPLTSEIIDCYPSLQHGSMLKQIVSREIAHMLDYIEGYCSYHGIQLVDKDFYFADYWDDASNSISMPNLH